MILINLLPHREMRRRRRQREFFAGVVGSLVLGAAIVLVWFSVLTQMTGDQRERNEFLKSEVGKLDAQIKDIATLRAEIEALKARQGAVENLQTDRNLPVYLLEELVRQTPEGVYLSSIKQTGDEIALQGTSQSNERISDFLRNTANNSPWLQLPQLIEIRSATAGAAAGREPRKVAQFSMRLKLKRPEAAAPATGSAPNPGAAKGVAPGASPSPAPAASPPPPAAQPARKPA